MNYVERRYLSNVNALEKYKIPNAFRIIAGLVVVFIIGIACLLWLTPWIQTARGSGEVSSLNPEDRIQAISALVPGKIEKWHVKEGDSVKAGDPIVTLIDTDQSLLERLDTQIAALEQQLASNQAAIATTQKDLKRRKTLLDQGLASRRDVEQVQLRLQSLEATAAKSKADLSQMRGSQARQSLRTKYAPRNGTILQLMSAGTSTLVSAGQILAQFIPEDAVRSVVLYVNGLDAPLITEGARVRLQFDGWPVFQFSGWPSTAVGTFGGVVQFVEPIANQAGQFRVWIAEDPDDMPWPSTRYARLGSKVRGWILLKEVRLGYELWRLLNNFPPLNPAAANTGGSYAQY